MSKWPHVALTAGGLILADQLTKLAVWRYLAPVRQIEVIPDFFDLTFVLNTGVAFGFMAGASGFLRTALLAGTALLALGVIIAFIVKTRAEERLFLTGLSLITGGAVGNLIDRIRLGAVIDFLDFFIGSYHWPAFNLADSGITAGVGLILLHFWKNR